MNYSNYSPDKKSVILYGDSFTFGSGLSDNQTFSYKLQNYTQRLVYNRGLAGYGIQHMLYLVLNNIEIMKQDKNFIEPEYVIYTFIEDHIHRICKSNDFFDRYLMYYKYNKDKTSLVQFSDFDLLYWHSYILRSLYYNNYNSSLEYGENVIILSDDDLNYILEHFLLANYNIKKAFNNSKFVIFVYQGDYVIKQIESRLKEQNIQVVYLSELSEINFQQDKYRLDEQHPTEEAWEIIVPLLAKKLELI